MQTALLRQHARKILEEQEVGCVIGYSVSPRNRTRPEFVYQVEDVDRLTLNQHMTHNLTRYLREKQKDFNPADKIGVVLKPCDSKALNVLIAENKIDRNRVYIIGVSCNGVFSDDRETEMQARCLGCSMDKPLVYDYFVENDNSHPAYSQDYEMSSIEIEDIDRYLPLEKAVFWNEQFDRCIRCYACRQACPICDCPTCIYERDDSLWIGAGNSIQEKRAFHLGRAFHLAGRCVGCNACEDACPVDIPIRLLNQKITQYMAVQFGFEAGKQISLSPLVTALGEKG